MSRHVCMYKNLYQSQQSCRPACLYGVSHLQFSENVLTVSAHRVDAYRHCRGDVLACHAAVYESQCLLLASGENVAVVTGVKFRGLPAQGVHYHRAPLHGVRLRTIQAHGEPQTV